jgi:lipopolysaccharide cholinephosphotransferase
MESKGMVLGAADLRKLQMVLLEILVETDRICKKHNIKYCIVGGTLLGAVRHKGFIPWDDDVDISMSRREYERFREVCKTELDQNRYFFQDHTTDPEYNFYWTKILRNGTEFVGIGREHLKKRTGICVDVNITDAVPDHYPFKVFHRLRCLWLRKHLYSRTGMRVAESRTARFIYRQLSKVPLKVIFGKLDRIAERYADKKTKLVRHYTFQLPRKRKLSFGWQRVWREDLCELEFEGLNFPAPKQWQEDLTYTYGDYMTLPPPEERVAHPASSIKLPEECEFYGRVEIDGNR